MRDALGRLERQLPHEAREPARNALPLAGATRRQYVRPNLASDDRTIGGESRNDLLRRPQPRLWADRGRPPPLAGDPVLVAIEAPVVRHRELVELRAALEVRHRCAARMVTRANPAEAVRVLLCSGSCSSCRAGARRRSSRVRHPPELRRPAGIASTSVTAATATAQTPRVTTLCSGMGHGTCKRRMFNSTPLAST